MDKKVIVEVLEAYLMINADVLEEEEREKIQRQIDALKVIEVNYDAFTNLLMLTIYDWFLRDERIHEFEEIKKYCSYLIFGLDDQVVKDSYDFAVDLYHDNEMGGNHEFVMCKRIKHYWKTAD